MLPIEKCNENRPRKKCCIDLIVVILSVILAFSVGGILGAFNAILVFVSLAAIIVFSIVIAILLAIRIILLLCNKKC